MYIRLGVLGMIRYMYICLIIIKYLHREINVNIVHKGLNGLILLVIKS